MTEQLSPMQRAKWRGFVHFMMEDRPPLGTTLAQSHPLVFEGGYARIGVTTAFLFAQLDHRESRQCVEYALREWFNTRTTFEVVKVKVTDDLVPTFFELEEEARRSSGRPLGHEIEGAVVVGGLAGLEQARAALNGAWYTRAEEMIERLIEEVGG